MVQFSSVAQSCPTLCDPIDRGPTRLLCPWDSPGKNTGAGCHFLLQCMKVKSESEVDQSCLTSDPMDCSLPGSSVHGIFQARVLEWVAIAFSCLAAKTCLTLCVPMNYSPPGSSVPGIPQARIVEWFAILFSRGSSQPRYQTPVSYAYCIGWWVLYH